MGRNKKYGCEMSLTMGGMRQDMIRSMGDMSRKEECGRYDAGNDKM